MQAPNRRCSRDICVWLLPPLLCALISAGCASIQGGSGGGGGNTVPLAITTATLPNAQVGVAYSATLTASGGKAPYTWSLMSGTLPAGLSLNPATGAVSGMATATASGVALTFQVQDSESPAQSKSLSLTMTVTPASVTITTSSLANGQVSVAYNATLTVSGGTSPYTWSLTSGTLPAGLSLNASTGAISGTPTATVTSTPLTFQVQDSSNPQQTKTVNLTLTILPPPPAISTAALPNGQVGLAYNTTLTATGGTSPYTWSLTSGTLPAGLSLNTSTGVISGTPTAPITSDSLTFKVTDSGTPEQTAPKTLTLTISPATLAITTNSLPNGQVGVTYSSTLAASGGTTPYTWSLISGTLPAGLSLNAATGAITGTPTAAVSSSPLTFQVQDSENPKQTKTISLSLTIAPTSLAITTSSLPSGQIGVAYSASLVATGGTSPYTWSITSGTLPAGLSLNASTGAITGTPTTAVSSTPLTFQVQDSESPKQTKTVNLTLTIAPATLTITTASLPNGQVGVGYSATLAATGGTPPYTWSIISGTLPAGLSLNASTGAITGTPTAAVTSTPLTFQVQDSGSPKQTKTLNITLTIAPPGLSITTTSLPNGQVGVAYSATLAASGGTTPYTWSIITGTLPAGLSLNASAGAITGTPTTAVTSTPLTFQVQDSESPKQTKTVNLTLTISPAALTISTASLPNGQVGVAYSATLAATGGTTPYTWSITSGTLPAGLSLNASTGAITGTPTAAVTSTPLTFQVQDSESPKQSKSVNLTLTVAPPGLAITTSSLPNGQVGTAYSTTLAATGGTTPYTWSITSGVLPAGLSLNASTGAITGTPTAAVNATPLTIQVQDSESPQQTRSENLTLTITPATLSVTTTSLPNGQVGTSYSASLAATGGTTPYTWSITSGSLPTGLSLNPSTGAITGTPTAAVTNSSIAFKVTDSGSPAQNAPATLTITIAPATLAISTSSLPSGQVGVAYSTTLAATGGTTPYSWSITSGTLPAGLSLNASTGAITGTPTGSANATPLTFQVQDSGSPKQTKTVNLTLTIAPATLAITTISLPNGTVNVAYSATLAATGGTTPYNWSITSGTLPAGLSLNASTGAITGTPTAAVTSTPLTFQVQDSGAPQQTKTVNLTLTIGTASNISVSISPKRGGVVINQSLTLTATVTNDVGSAGVNWSVSSGGALQNQTTSTTSFSAASAGLYTITATSNADGTQSATVTIGVTNLAGVATYHNDLSRDGSNSQEYALTTSNVTTSTFGKLFSCTVDGAVYAQPLWVPNLTIGGVTHNVVFVATQHDGLFAFDADANPCVQLWSVSLIDAAHGANSGETSVPSGPGGLVGGGSGDITPEVGVTGTPVIDLTSNTLYVVSKSVNSAGNTFYQRLHGIDLLTGNEKLNGNAPVLISGTYPGTGDGGSTDAFNAQQENERCGLALVNGTVYIAWASHEDNPPYYGWIIGYNASTLAQTSVLNVTPNVGYGGVWMSGAAPAADSSNNLYLLSGNGVFDANDSSAPNNDYGDSLLKLSPSLGILSYFTPSDQASDDAGDQDFGAGGAALLIDLPTGTPNHFVVGGGKDGSLYLINRDSLGGYGDSNALQKIGLSNGIFSTGAFWNNSFYMAPINSHLYAYTFNTTSRQFTTPASSQSGASFGFPGSSPSVSSLGSSNGIVWALNNGNYCTPQSGGCGPTVLHAFDATNLATELWNSSQSSGDAAGNAVKFTIPTVANGKVYVGTRGNNTGGTYGSTSKSGELDVYGLKPN